MNSQHAPTSPRVPASTENATTIPADAAALVGYLRAFQVRFDADRKVAQAVAFSVSSGGSSLALPTKLVGTVARQANLRMFASGLMGKVEMRPLSARLVPDDREEGRERVALSVNGCPLGFLKDKHARWLLPLLTVDERGAVTDACGIGFFALMVTGGTEERPTYGLNVCITGLGARLRSDEAPTPHLNHYDAERAAEALSEPETALDAARRRNPGAYELDFLGADDEPLIVLYDGGMECDPDGRYPAWVLDLVEVYDAEGADITARYADEVEAAIWKAARESREAEEEARA